MHIGMHIISSTNLAERFFGILLYIKDIAFQKLDYIQYNAVAEHMKCIQIHFLFSRIYEMSFEMVRETGTKV